MLQTVESNRLRRFGRLRDFSRSCFSLACAARIIFFAKIARAGSDPLAPCSIDAVGFYTYDGASAPPWTLTITIRLLLRLKKTSGTATSRRSFSFPKHSMPAHESLRTNQRSLRELGLPQKFFGKLILRRMFRSFAQMVMP